MMFLKSNARFTSHPSEWKCATHEHNMSAGLSLHKMRIIQHPILMRYDAEEQISTLRSVFGSCYGFGINDRKPNIGKSLLPKANTTINVLKSSTVDDTFRIRTLSKGVDFIYNISINRLTIKLRIEQFIAPKTGM